ncbi:MAG: Halimadienyl diphosphate synthase (type-B diterpene cyclase) [Anaerolineaceae bacterium]|nr:MAG: Halimadienyl diphosphate synthase (type-B diterpene cyclase) [Anaerolineaceae bacterium]
MNINAEINKLLNEIGSGQMSNTPYDTSWIARLEHDPEMSNNALSWLCDHQLPDGSWGSRDPFYYHDRVICTLAAMIALTRRGRRIQDKIQIERGLAALEKITVGATTGLAADPNGATVGFEMIAPTLVTEAVQLGIIKQQADRILGRLARQREIKMAKLAGYKINRFVTISFSAEMAGDDGKNMLDSDNMQEANGSVGNSPSATAYFLLNIQPASQSAMTYLRDWVTADGGAPDFAPIDIFELAWTLWNVGLSADLGLPVRASCNPHLDTMKKAWKTGKGIGTASQATLPDGDDTGLVYHALGRFGSNMDIQSVLSYEEGNHFRCFSLEADPSISTNIHILGALQQAGLENAHPAVQKVLAFLRNSRVAGKFWFDKWHASPYYATSHAIINTCRYDRKLAKQAVDWILESQKPNGAWGFFHAPTAEETAYCIQALSVWNQTGGKIDPSVLRKASDWLLEHAEPPYPPMWIGKCLYCPEKVVRSSILSALSLAGA